MVWINGVETDKMSVADRAFQYGDGCFTTILVEQGAPRLWSQHLTRLKLSLQKLNIAAPEWSHITETVMSLAQGYPHKGVIKVFVSRGAGGRGYSPAGCQNTQVVVSDFPWPAHYAQWQQEGIELGVCRQRLGLSPMLAGLKHANRLEQVLLKQEIDANGWLDAVVLDANGDVAETCASNIFWRKGNTLYTPELSLAGVHGLMRAHVCELAAALGFCLEYVKSTLDDLLCADEVFITNALMALVPVTKIQHKTYQERRALEAITKRLYSC
ncbi:aminodeoxychorismate lyase [Photobacterium sp. 1_MG-2023]|uniref:aminodeoxychorismate lyase n=1 Tax=Photobacterium sp. 1_MG-2023 TaxID=3062646 RepID=UPI0026E2AF2F|nr:aminodeoxychorismate lyase [Photobacterium sp. 1_MG-2023]MDO6705748.1 aminodeoxychorismate lyase [Photobacterium sp. 1_MG-2023]